MTFEMKDRDLLGRIGRLHTKSGTVETPLFFPVINPTVQLVSPRRIREEFGFDALLANAYILKKRFRMQPVENGLHRFLDFNGVVMTDSGAYQILVYGNIEETPKEIVKYQEQIGTDIATILDLPTGWEVTRRQAEHSVNVTLERAEELFETSTRKDILWVGPVQGGRHLDLVSKCASKIGKLPFQMYALGSPTEVMERYRFDILVDMILAAKMKLPIESPLHLFGAGHPFMFSLAVALGCDLFDSAAYAIYARENRYMTEYGTSRLKQLEYFPCTCRKCSEKTPKEVKEMPQREREVFLAEHNLYVCLAELRRIKQAIREGRLWELLQMRAHGHPALLQALKRFKRYDAFVEKHSPTVKASGIFFFSSIGIARPYVVRYRNRLSQRYSQPKETRTLLLLPRTKMRRMHNSKEFKKISKLLQDQFKEQMNKIHTCFYAVPFGVIPIELDEIYPLSQYEIARPPDEETTSYATEQMAEYITRTYYKHIILLNDPENWNRNVLDTCRKTCRSSDVGFRYVNMKEGLDKATLASLKKILHKTMSEQS